MNFLIVCLIVFSIVTADVRVPLTQVPDGLLQVAGMDLHNGLNLNMILGNMGVHFYCVFRIIAEQDFEVQLYDSELLPFHFDAQRVDVLGELVPQIGPIAIRQSDERFELILNSTQEYFESVCSPGSILATRLAQWNTMTLSMSVGDSNLYSQESFRVDYSVSYLGDVPGRVYDAIIESIRASGAVSVQRGYVIDSINYMEFSDCSLDHIASFPDIEYSFEAGGRLLLTPDDYLVFNAVSRTCQLRFTRCVPLFGSHCRFHPLAIRGVGVRISPDRTIEFCDSI